MFKINFNYIKIIGLLLVVAGLLGFSNQRNNSRKVSLPQIKFIGESNLFVTESIVSKLLIQNKENVIGQPKEILDLNILESTLNAHPIIKNSEVFLDLNGKLYAEIEQKTPIARVNASSSYYIDTEGGVMPMSSNYTARVPLVSGEVNKTNLNTVFAFSKMVYEDEFLKKHVIQIHQNNDKTIDFRVRQHDFNVHVGRLDLVNKKITNFKVFYKKALKDNILATYKNVDLQFDKQVICTKK